MNRRKKWLRRAGICARIIWFEHRSLRIVSGSVIQEEIVICTIAFDRPIRIEWRPMEGRPSRDAAIGISEV